MGDPSHVFNTPHTQDELSLKVLTLQDQVFYFVKSFLSILEERNGDIGSLTFNKDDELCIEFVSASTNIRAHNFGIALESKFKIKEMAGKIIPAISSSNAMVAAL